MADEQLAALQAQLAALQEQLAIQQSENQQTIQALAQAHQQQLQQLQQQQVLPAIAATTPGGDAPTPGQAFQNATARNKAQLPAEQGQSDERPSVCRVAVKLPTFWADKPAVWFAQAEAQFLLSNIMADKTRYNYVVSILDSRYANEVEDILTNPPAENRYQYLKTELIRRLSLSEDKKVRQLLQAEELGDRKPSQFLRHLRSLASSFNIQDSFVRNIWVQHLPISIQAILQAQTETPLDKLADLADRIIEVSPPSLPVSVQAINSPPDLTALHRRFDALERQLKALQLGSESNRSRSRGPSRQRLPNHSEVTPSPVDPNTCYYHRRFGNRARKCQPPCSQAAPVPENANGRQ